MDSDYWYWCQCKLEEYNKLASTSFKVTTKSLDRLRLKIG